MKEIAREQVIVENRTLCLALAALCTFLLLIAYVYSSPFVPQLLIYLFLLFVSKDMLKDGFAALSTFAPDAKSLVFVSSFFALLHGLSTFEVKNCFFYAGAAVSLSEFGDYICIKHFAKVHAYKTFADKLCSLAVPLSLVILVVTAIINLVGGKTMLTVITNSFLLMSTVCPCTVLLLPAALAAIYAKRAEDGGVSFLHAAAPEKLGIVKEVIFEQRGIVTEKNYSLYDIYAIDGDKAGLLAAAAAIEKHFDHPFAAAIISAAKSVCAPILTADDCFEVCGKGVCATVAGDKYFLGNKKLLRDKKITVPEAVSGINFGYYTPLYVAKNDVFLGVMLFYGKPAFAAAETLDAIYELGIRRILLTDREREDLKAHFDILLTEREKVLQELKKGAKIKAMTVTEAPIAKADVVAVTFPCEGADITVNSLQSVMTALIIGRKALALIKLAVTLSLLSSLTFAVFAALGMFFFPLLSMAVTALPLAACIGASHIKIPQFTSSEEDNMLFGKVNYTMKIQGMSCSHCSARVKSALESLRGVSATVSLEEKLAHIKCPASTTAETLAKAVTDVGFTVVSTERV
ncbi:MAG: cation transporter [Clostridia bacterium]|nr:cation transporter [Clostridia bacterium]